MMLKMPRTLVATPDRATIGTNAPTLDVEEIGLTALVTALAMLLALLAPPLITEVIVELKLLVKVVMTSRY
jgi:hypothetical protein